MAFSPIFSVSQGVDVQSFTITDASTGTDAAIAGRRIYLTKADGTYLTPNGSSTTYIDFPLVDGSYINLTGILNVDYCLNIVVNWVDVSGNVLYTNNGLYLFTGNSELFFYGLTQLQAQTPNIVKDTQYYSNKLILRVEIDSANNALLFSDQSGAQQCLDRAQYMITNSNLYF